ncbi:hypothetical protein M0R45_027716 [Rubus argutus]|uniref:Uncharacterized protein n=1 Tax=Rubus argutus TaxID=59490 RepID=A0AAW1X231_RUBAR
MAQTCVSTSTSSLRFNSLGFAPNPSSCSQPQSLTVSLPFQLFPSRKLKKFVGNRKSIQNSPVKAVYADEFWVPGSREGIWSIREDLQVPSSPYFPAYAQGQGPPLWCKNAFKVLLVSFSSIE